MFKLAGGQRGEQRRLTEQQRVKAGVGRRTNRCNRHDYGLRSAAANTLDCGRADGNTASIKRIAEVR
jgi:hypothetical protein